MIFLTYNHFELSEINLKSVLGRVMNSEASKVQKKCGRKIEKIFFKVIETRLCPKKIGPAPPGGENKHLKSTTEAPPLKNSELLYHVE